jgi:hypothetical protein
MLASDRQELAETKCIQHISSEMGNYKNYELYTNT